jgi:PD-(D/E)XK nuclease superfamily
MTPSQAAQQYHWCKYDPETNTVSLYLDHHMLSTLRTCESKFVLEHILNIRPKGHKAWHLIFGAWMHYCFEKYYNHLKDNNGQPIDIGEFLRYGREMWDIMKLDAYKEEKKYIEISGWDGASALLVEYWAIYQEQRMRVVATEIPFGIEEAVWLDSFSITESDENLLIVKCYLTGRIDLLVDNGSTIGPVDHKHTHIFRGDEWTKFNPQDGITGYIYATSFILAKYFPDYKYSATVGWIFHIQGKSPSYKNVKKGELAKPRFKASRVDKNPQQLADFAARQVTTFKRVCSLLFNNESPQWNTNNCHFMFGRKCEYLPIHETDPAHWNDIIQQYYNITTEWNPTKPEESIIIRDDVMNENIINTKEEEE